MPLYDFSCTNCGPVKDVFAKMEDMEVPCPKCGEDMQRLFSPTRNIIADLEPYLDENLGHTPVYVKSKRHKRDLLKRANLVEIG